jgi:hypothetical protein
VEDQTEHSLRSGRRVRTLDVNLGMVISGSRSQRVRVVLGARRCSCEHARGV